MCINVQNVIMELLACTSLPDLETQSKLNMHNVGCMMWEQKEQAVKNRKIAQKSIFSFLRIISPISHNYAIDTGN